jgi:hybrid cluster-associated redox disulfide protein
MSIEDKITKDMIIMDIVHDYPETMEIFAEYGIHCVGCSNAMFENIEQGAALHGFNLEEMLDDLNSIF